MYKAKEDTYVIEYNYNLETMKLDTYALQTIEGIDNNGIIFEKFYDETDILRETYYVTSSDTFKSIYNNIDREDHYKVEEGNFLYNTNKKYIRNNEREYFVQTNVTEENILLFPEGEKILQIYKDNNYSDYNVIELIFAYKDGIPSCYFLIRLYERS